MTKTNSTGHSKQIVAEELPILPQHLSSLPILPQHLSSLPILPQHLSFSGVRVTRSLDLCVCFVDRSLVLFLLSIVLSVLLRYTDSDYPFGIFKLFLKIKKNTRLSEQFQNL